MNIVLWILQVLVGLLFVLSGVMKLFVLPAEKMMEGMPHYLSLNFLYFIGVCEILGGIGLIVPWATGVIPKLTPIAAGLLVIIMIGAVVVSAPMGIVYVILPFVVGVLCAFIAFGRWRSSALS
jgi:uncharacterized membrane protein YphA (DoxX/SURF4 family)